ncbi:septal ring lytic transglycosylase RlpA family protein [Aureimonas sp. ME7]|uniref:septal ring lytic transglycosylase RlpA family protein n=1 Tax=Aureimonas sp. ME7 TaxID=2744252 RepID=UPI0015FB56E4|nr:septal ring lytic transglycosylase RlpA family protein [Aureimonas sp. ME7]
MMRETGRGRVAKLGLFVTASMALAGCQSTSSSTHDELAPEDDAPIFSSSIFGVKASPRVTRSKTVPKGGGRDQTGKPYVVRGKWYYPKEEPGYVKSGTASWYGANFHGRLTANGEVYDMYHLSAAHPTFPLPSYARVTNKANGNSVLVRVNDRGPYMHDRVLDVSAKAAEVLAFKNDGIADVKVEYVGRAPLEGDDTRMLMASFRPGDGRAIDSGLPSGVMIASRKPAEPTLLASLFTSKKAVAQPRATPAAKPSMRTPSIEDLIQTYDRAAVPVPLSRNALLSFASDEPKLGSHLALSQIMSGVGMRETIEIGEIDDFGVLARVSDLLGDRGVMREEKTGGRTSLAVDLRAGQDADGILQEIWSAGASDAFVLKTDQH